MSWSFVAAGTVEEAKQQLAATPAEGVAAMLRDAAIAALNETAMDFPNPQMGLHVVVKSNGHVGRNSYPTLSLTIEGLSVRKPQAEEPLSVEALAP